jgi:ADP-heptose:LPS heptosyltransferase
MDEHATAERSGRLKSSLRDVADRVAHALIRVASHIRAPIGTTQRRVLVVRSTSIGDFTTFLPFVASIVRQYGAQNVDVLELSRFGPIAGRFLPTDVRAITLPMADAGAVIAEARSCREVVREGGYGRVIFAGHSSESPVPRLKKLLLIRYLVGVRPRLDGFRADMRMREPPGFAPQARDGASKLIFPNQALATFLRTGRRVDVSREDVHSFLRFTGAERSRVDATLRGIDAGGRTLVGVFVNSRLPMKMWPVDKYELVCRALLERPRTHICLIGGDEDLEASNRFAARFGGNVRVHVITGGLSLREHILLLGRMSLVLGNDGASMHLAALAGVPVVSVFCNREPEGFWEPILAPASRSVRPAWTLRDPARGDFGIDRVGAEHVISCAELLLDSVPRPRHAIIESRGDEVPPGFRAIDGFPFLERSTPTPPHLALHDDDRHAADADALQDDPTR